MNSPKKVIVVGGGLSGLTAGIYLLKYGFEVELLEKNHYLGGLCTGWVRKGSYIDGCIHWLTESGHGELHDVMRELGLIKSEDDIINLDIYSQTTVNGKSINIYTDPDKLEKELLSFAKPNDVDKIKFFIKHVKRCSHNLITAGVPYHHWNLWHKLKFIWRILPLIGTMKNFAKVSIADWANTLESDDLRFCFNHLFVPCQYSMFSLLNTIGGICDENGGLPVGGSKQFAQKLADEFTKLGGKVRTDAAADKVLVDGDRVTGVMLKNGEKLDCDFAVTACDLHYTLHSLLDNQFQIKRLGEYDDNKKGAPIYSLYMVSCRTRKDLSGIKVNRYFQTDKYSILSSDYDSLYIKHFGYDQSLSKDGYTTVQLIIESKEQNYDELDKMSKEEYANFKQQLAQQMIGIANAVCGDEYGELELLDVCTPLTFTHWTNSYKGTFMTYMLTENNKQLILRNDILPLRNFALAGHWMMMPGGVPIAIMQGKFAAMTIHHQSRFPHLFNPAVLRQAMEQSSLHTEASKLFKRNV